MKKSRPKIQIKSDMYLSVLFIRTNFLKIRRAVTLIQRIWRGYISREHYAVVSL